MDDAARGAELERRGVLRIRQGMLAFFSIGVTAFVLSSIIGPIGLVSGLALDAGLTAVLLAQGMSLRRRGRALRREHLRLDALHADAALDAALAEEKEAETAGTPTVLLDAPTGLPWERH